MRIAILADDVKDNAKKWGLACQKKHLTYEVINLLKNDFYKQLVNFNPDFCLLRPPGDILANKLLFDKNLLQLKTNGIITYPSYEEVKIYENKEALCKFLIKHQLPHPKTVIIKNKEKALEYGKVASLPIVGKTLIGASGSGVKIIRTREELLNYIEEAFEKGIGRRSGPNRKAGGPIKWAYKAIKSPTLLIKKLKIYHRRNKEKQQGLILLQEFIAHDFEWRVVKIGESYFGYKKINDSGMSSGSKLFEYGPPPPKLLNFTKHICEKFNFNFMAIDYLPHNDEFLINEMQTIFGHANPFICKVDNESGRYLFKDDKWVFESGDFNTNESFDLRLETAIKLYQESKNNN